jgi:hypothetical protein
MKRKNRTKRNLMTYRHSIQTILAAALSLASAIPSFAAEPLAVGCAKQLFIDQRFIESAKGVQLAVNRPRLTGERLLTPEKPWEDMCLGGYHSVIQEGDRIHLWYEVMDRRDMFEKHGNGVAYAFSTDGGKTWTRPNLGIIEYEGSKDNNLVIRDTHGEHVFRNRPDAPASERYCMFSARGSKLFVSPDGFHWTYKKTKSMFDLGGREGLDSQNVIFWDTRINKYVAYPRVYFGSLMRCVGRTETDVLGDFPVPKNVFGHDEKDPPKMDYYTSAAIQYPYAADAYFMFPAAYYHTTDALDVQFAASRDGITWLRPDRRPIIRTGFSGQWDAGAIYAGYGLSRHGDELSLYYSAFDVTHGGYLERGYLGGVLSRAIYRLDGFMSADAGYEGGQFTTPPLVFTGERLEINFDGSAGGGARVEILDGAGKPIPGFTEKEADQISGNAVAKKVTWGGKGDLTSLKGAPVKLRFVMRDCKLYAFQFKATSDDPPAKTADFLPMGVYWPWETTAPAGEGAGRAAKLEKLVGDRLDQLAAHNVNTVWTTNGPGSVEELGLLCRLAEARGIRIVAGGGDWYMSNANATDQWAQATVARIRTLWKSLEGKPRPWMFTVADEPSEKNMDVFARYVAAMKGAGIPVTTVLTRADVAAAAAKVAGFSYVCVDCYPFFGSRHGPRGDASYQYYETVIGQFIQASNPMGAKAWVMPQAFQEIRGPARREPNGDATVLPGGGQVWLMPSPAQVRWQAWAATALGAKGVLFFAYGLTYELDPKATPLKEDWAVKTETPTGAPTSLVSYPDNRPGPQMQAMASVFSEIKPLAPLLLQLVRVEKTTGLVGLADKPGFAGDMANVLADPKSGKRYVAVVASPKRSGQPLVLRLGSGALRLTSIGASPAATKSTAGGPATVEIALAPGQGAIYELNGLL